MSRLIEPFLLKGQIQNLQYFIIKQFPNQSSIHVFKTLLKRLCLLSLISVDKKVNKPFYQQRDKIWQAEQVIQECKRNILLSFGVIKSYHMLEHHDGCSCLHSTTTNTQLKTTAVKTTAPHRHNTMPWAVVVQIQARVGITIVRLLGRCL